MPFENFKSQFLIQEEMVLKITMPTISKWPFKKKKSFTLYFCVLLFAVYMCDFKPSWTTFQHLTKNIDSWLLQHDSSSIRWSRFSKGKQKILDCFLVSRKREAQIIVEEVEEYHDARFSASFQMASNTSTFYALLSYHFADWKLTSLNFNRLILQAALIKMVINFSRKDKDFYIGREMSTSRSNHLRKFRNNRWLWSRKDQCITLPI